MTAGGAGVADDSWLGVSATVSFVTSFSLALLAWAGGIDAACRGRAEGAFGLKASPPFFLNMELISAAPMYHRQYRVPTEGIP